MRAERRTLAPALAAALVCTAAAPAAALGGRVNGVRVVDGRIRGTLALADAFTERTRRILEEGATLHLRVEAGLWEDRPVWDRPLEAPRVVRFRLAWRAAEKVLAVVDPGGGVTSSPQYPNPLPIAVELGAAAAVVADARYYVHAIVTLGTLGEDTADEASEAIFGRDDGSPGLSQVGRFLLNTVLRLSDYAQSESVEIRGAPFRGERLRSP